MEIADIQTLYGSMLEDLVRMSTIDETIFDREAFQIYVATVWGNSVLEPERMHLTLDDLPTLHDYLNEELEKTVGLGTSVTSCFEFIESKAGEDSMNRYRVTRQHREFLKYFARLVLTTTKGIADPNFPIS
jgi:hypothetical protein